LKKIKGKSGEITRAKRSTNRYGWCWWKRL